MCWSTPNSSLKATKGIAQFRELHHPSFPICKRLHLLTSSLHRFFLDLFLSLHPRGLSLWDPGKQVSYTVSKSHLWNPHQQPCVPGNLPREIQSHTSKTICMPLPIHSTPCLFQYLPSCVLKTSVQITQKMCTSGCLKAGNGGREGSLLPSSLLCDIFYHMHTLHLFFTTFIKAPHNVYKYMYVQEQALQCSHGWVKTVENNR